MNWWIIILGSMCTLLLVMLIDLHTQSIEARNQMAEYRLLSVQEFYIAIQDQIQQMHRCRHDLAKHIQILELLQETDQGFLQDYTEKLRTEYQRQKERSSRYCRHGVVNLILLLKEQQCQKLDIPFTATVSSSSLDTVGNLDWVGLLYNLLDNAIEASQRTLASSSSMQGGVCLRLEDAAGDGVRDTERTTAENTVRNAAGMLVLTVENPVLPGEKLSFSTRKENKELHGFGLEIVDEIVKKYGGKRTASLDKQCWKLRTCCTLCIGGQADE